MEKFAFSLMEIDVSLLFISCFSEYPVFSRITIQLKVLLSQQICGIIAAKQLLYPSYGQKEGRTMIGILFDFNGTMFFDESFQEESWKSFLMKKTGLAVTEKEFHKYIHGRNSDFSLPYFLGRPLSRDEIELLEEEKESIYSQHPQCEQQMADGYNKSIA